MATVILVGLIVVLLAAAAFVGVLLLRRTRSVPAVPEPDGERPRTVGELVRARSEPAELSGQNLFAPAVPRQDGVAVPSAPGSTVAEYHGAAPAAPAQPATPAGGLEVGDAPWRRAARMTGEEPGGAWETAPVQESASPSAVAVVPSPVLRRIEPVPAGPGSAHLPEAVPEAAQRPTPAEPEPAPVRLVAPSPWSEPADVVASAEADPEPEPEEAQPVGDSGHQAAVSTPSDPDPAPVEAPEPAAVSRPLSDPDLTPLMGIPIIRPVVADTPPVPVHEHEEQAAAADVPDDSPDHDVPASPRITDVLVPDDDVVVLLPSTHTSSFPVVTPPAASGSPQPVWFRDVRRDGDPVPAAVVALLDDRGREVDTTKTAVDGGGELRTPHGGRFLMIVSADGYQPRAAMLSVDEQPVELALLLPRSATVGGAVHRAGEPVRDALVIVRQAHDVVDEALTAGDGCYRFDDLAEGVYAVVATAGRDGAVEQVSLAEGADLHVDLDLDPYSGPR
jgi:hypothetical protein